MLASDGRIHEIAQHKTRRIRLAVEERRGSLVEHCPSKGTRQGESVPTSALGGLRSVRFRAPRRETRHSARSVLKKMICDCPNGVIPQPIATMPPRGRCPGAPRDTANTRAEILKPGIALVRSGDKRRSEQEQSRLCLRHTAKLTRSTLAESVCPLPPEFFLPFPVTYCGHHGFFPIA